MRLRIIGVSCAILFVVMLSGGLCAAADKPATQPAIDAKRVAALVDDLASDSFDTRQAASQKLEDMGPEVIAALEPFKQSENPEIRARVISIIRDFDWMKRGALVFMVWPGQLGEKLGFRFGDVVLKVNGTPITGHLDMRTVDRDVPGASTWVVWRDNKILRFVVPRQHLSISTISWDATHGGIEQARAFREMHAAKPDFDRAFTDLLAAQEAGTKGMWTLFYLSGLAARKMHPEQAAEAYEQARLTAQECCELTHWPILSPLNRLPFDGPAAQFFLKRYRNERYEPQLAHEIEDWFGQRVHNGPLLKELLAKTTAQQWRDEDTSYCFYHYRAAMRIAFCEHRDEEVLASPVRNPACIEFDVDDERAVLLLQSALRLGKVDEATKIVTAHDSEQRSYQRLREYELWAFSAACAANDRESIDTFLQRFKRLAPNELDALFRTSGGVSLQHLAALAELRRWWESTHSSNHRTPIAILSFTALAADPATTAKQFKAAIPPAPSKPRPQNEALAVATGLVRFGEYEEAAKVLSAGEKNAYGSDAQRILKDDADFAAKHRDELAGKWKELAGFIQVVHSGDKTTWVLRYDGAVFRIDADGTLAALPPLPPVPAPLTVGFTHLTPREKGVFAIWRYPRRNAATDNLRVADPVFCTDASQKRWLPLAQWDGKYDFKSSYALNRAIALARADRDHPLADGRPHELADGQTPLFICEGDLAYARNQKTQELTDLSVEIARLAGRKEPARIYAPGGLVGPLRLIFSDCGLWRFNQDTWELTRVKLGLPDENVMTVQMAGDHYTTRKDGFQMIGVVPQQGGQMFLVSPTTGESEPVKAFCGVGPKDWYGYAYSRNFADEMSSHIHALYLARLKQRKEEPKQ